MSMDQRPLHFNQMTLPLSEEEEELEVALKEDEPHVYSISELNGYIRNLLEGEFPHIWVKGEISNFKAHSSGHFYFSLKDKNSQINAVMFRGYNSKLKFRPETGMEVLINGKITVYEPRGNYQVLCQTMEPVGAGALQKSFEQLKEKLNREGLFSRNHKKPLPPFPQHVALITSPTGAAVRDMINVLKRRFKGLKITVIPVLVQGEEAAESITEGLKRAHLIEDLDVLIVGRGGGSMEDLWCFNNEKLARAIFDSKIPVVSAVGHEIDFTIADFVADLRAATPSVAAELVVKNAEECLETLKHLKMRLSQSWKQNLSFQRQHVVNLRQGLVDPQKKLQDLALRCDDWTTRLEQSIERCLKDWRSRTYNLGSLMDSLSPLKVLKRGYAVVQTGKSVAYTYKDLKEGDQVQVQLGEGGFKAQVTQINKGGFYEF